LTRSWNYSGRPSTSSRDKVRFLVGDTCEDDQQVGDDEIAFALSEYTEPMLAAALIARHLAAKYSRLVSKSVGDVSSSCDQKAKAYLEIAKALDPSCVTLSSSMRALPSFGGRSLSEKETFDEDTDAVQPSFRRGADDIPGGPDDSATTDTYDHDWT